jgi:hypothetical protein
MKEEDEVPDTKRYRLVSMNDPADGSEFVRVKGATEDDEPLTVTVRGEPVDLTDEQAEIIGRYGALSQVDDNEEGPMPVQIVVNNDPDVLADLSDEDLEAMNLVDLRTAAAERDIEGRSNMSREQLIAAIKKAQEGS